jgi:hypothetical protein
MNANKFRSVLTCALLLSGGAGDSPAADFSPVDGAAEQLQSRRYQVEDARVLLQASLAILQDIRYAVTKSELEPGLLVAKAPWQGCRCNRHLTISVEELPEEGFQVRLTAASTRIGTIQQQFNGDLEPEALDYTDFYQDFFTHLDRELFKETQR